MDLTPNFKTSLDAVCLRIRKEDQESFEKWKKEGIPMNEIKRRLTVLQLGDKK